jgi:hypothetical protein
LYLAAMTIGEKGRAYCVAEVLPLPFLQWHAEWVP